MPVFLVINHDGHPNYWRNTSSEFDVCEVGSSDHLLLWLWRREEKRAAAAEELNVCCVYMCVS
jgi:hypothetical protein